LKVWSRRSMITPPFVGFKVGIHNGKTFNVVEVKEKMLGHKFGEFSVTRKRPSFPEKSTKMIMPAKGAAAKPKK